MPHCQKEKHNHASRSKKEKQRKKEQLAARKAALKEAEEAAELERLKGTNNIALKDGYGEYEIGCEEEMEYVAKFNMNKRSKKHLRMDIIKQQQKAEREEEERIKCEQERQYRLEQEKLKQNTTTNEKDEEEEGKVEGKTTTTEEEYLVYICQCCNKMFKTTNAFKNHTDSKKHLERAKLFEEAGVIVTEVMLADELNVDELDYVVGEEEDEYINVNEETKEGYGSEEDGGEVHSEDEEEEEEDTEKVGSLFSALAAFSDDSSSSSSSDESSDGEENDDDRDDCTASSSNKQHEANTTTATAIEDGNEWEDDLDLLEDIIYQNRLNEQLYPDDDGNGSGEEKKAVALPSVVFDDDQYDLDDNFNGDRLAAVQHRLQKRLAAKGIEPNQIQPGYRSSDAVSIGKTLLQEVMDANIENMGAKLAVYKQHKAEHQLLGREFRFAKGNSKALASQYSYRIDPSDNARQRANVHHTGSHYHMAASRSMYYGRSKGLMARHSAQGSRLQASRMAAQETRMAHSKGQAKVGKTSKKSTQKRRGEAGGSKKTGGMASSASEN